MFESCRAHFSLFCRQPWIEGHTVSVGTPMRR